MLQTPRHPNRSKIFQNCVPAPIALAPASQPFHSNFTATNTKYLASKRLTQDHNLSHSGRASGCHGAVVVDGKGERSLLASWADEKMTAALATKTAR